MIFSKFTEFSVLRAIHPPETLIFLRNYWCFRDASIFVEFFIFTKTAEICEIIKNFTFSHFSSQIHILWKIDPGSPKKPKKGWNCIGFKGPGASGPRGTKNTESYANRAKYFAFSMEIRIFIQKVGKFWKIIILRSPETLVFLVKYYTFSRAPLHFQERPSILMELMDF